MNHPRHSAKQTRRGAFRQAAWASPRLLFATFAACVLNGCGTTWPSTADIGPTYRPANIYREGDRLPVAIRRVAVLPLTASDSNESLDAGTDALEPVLQAELGKSQRFEIVPVSDEQLRQWTGRTSWRNDEALPADLFAHLRAETGCDGVLFSQLTVYRAYTPLAVGWKFSLVACTGEKTGKILWSADEVVDSGEPDVSRGARGYYSWHVRNPAIGSDSSMILYSPRQFGQYSLTALLDTLPAR